MSANIYQFEAKLNNGQVKSLQEYKGKVLLVVNTASKCGFTPQYGELQELYQQYQSQGLEILGFPCDQFGHQEPGNDEQIEAFCSLNFNLSFYLFAKVEVNGPHSHPIFTFLKHAAPGILGSKRIKWNFTKFLINKHGEVVKRYAPATKPQQITQDIATQLNL
ncbi:MAG: glutathione peroxidase [Paraglaciecola sp.]|jgi:glutathione peroxidase